jgi:tryptophan synthase alpha chain
MLVSRPATKIARVFQRCRGEGRAAFIPFLMAGDPSIHVCVELLTVSAQSGADIIELGIPYSDPLADGPTIQGAARRALSAGSNFSVALKIARRVRERAPQTPLIGFTYYNPVFVRGLERTAQEFADAGISGIVVPDLPPMEAMPLIEAFRAKGLAVALLVAPTTPPGRAGSIAALCTDFVYVVGRMGVSGADRRFSDQAREQIARLRQLTDKPLALGFGVASPQDAAEVATFADGVIVGSALIDRVAAAQTAPEMVEQVKHLCRYLSLACRQGSRRA